MIAFLSILSLIGIPYTFSFLAKEELIQSAILLPSLWIPFVLGLIILGNIFIVGFATRFLFIPLLREDSIDKEHIHFGFHSALLISIPLLFSLTGILIPFSPYLKGIFYELSNHLLPNMEEQSQHNEGITHISPYVILLPSIIAWLCGIALGFYHIWRERSLKATHQSPFATRIYQHAIYQLIRQSDRITRLFQNGKLRSYLQTFAFAVLIVSTIAMISEWKILHDNIWPHITHPERNTTIYDYILIISIFIGILGVIFARTKLTAVICLGIVGYGMAIVFLIFSSPDLAMTQFIIETLTVSLFVFVFYHLPEQPLPQKKYTRYWNLFVCILFGIVMGVLTLSASSIQTHPSISSFFTLKSLNEAHGGNIVNVILVDFRGFDTLGEITVLAIAGIGTYALLRYQRRET